MQTITHSSSIGYNRRFVYGLWLIELSFSSPDINPDTKLQTQSQPPTVRKKSIVGTRLSFLHNQSKHTNEKTQCLSHPKNTQHLNVTAKAGQAFIGIDVKRRSLCDTPSVGEGQWGPHGQPPAVRSICVGDSCGIWTLRLWRRWISYRCLCQRGPITNQMHM